jgi:hypothetical protein
MGSSERKSQSLSVVAKAVFLEVHISISSPLRQFRNFKHNLNLNSVHTHFMMKQRNIKKFVQAAQKLMSEVLSPSCLTPKRFYKEQKRVDYQTFFIKTVSILNILIHGTQTGCSNF